jgi:hypothetical protein
MSRYCLVGKGAMDITYAWCPNHESSGEATSDLGRNNITCTRPHSIRALDARVPAYFQKKKIAVFFSTATIFVKTIIGNVPLKIKISLFFKNFCEKKLHIFLSLVISLSVS